MLALHERLAWHLQAEKCLHMLMWSRNLRQLSIWLCVYCYLLGQSICRAEVALEVRCALPWKRRKRPSQEG